MSQGASESLSSGDTGKVAPKFGELTYEDVIRRTTTALQKGEFVTLVGTAVDTEKVVSKTLAKQSTRIAPLRIKLDQEGTTFEQVLQNLRAQLVEMQILDDVSSSSRGNRMDFADLAQKYGLKNLMAVNPPVITIEGIEKLSAQGLEDLISTARALHTTLGGSETFDTQKPAVVLTGTKSPLDLIILRSKENKALTGMHYGIGQEFKAPPAPLPPRI